MSFSFSLIARANVDLSVQLIEEENSISHEKKSVRIIVGQGRQVDLSQFLKSHHITLRLYKLGDDKVVVNFEKKEKNYIRNLEQMIIDYGEPASLRLSKGMQTYLDIEFTANKI